MVMLRSFATASISEPKRVRACYVHRTRSYPTVFPQFARLAANLASAKRLVCGDSDTLANGFMPTTIYVKAQSAKFLLHLQDFKLGSACFLEFGNQRFQVLAEPPHDGEPSVVMSEAPWHQCVLDVAPGVEPSGPSLDQTLL
jgi:hypothetical protein